MLVREAGKLAGIPGVLIHGRLDISSPADIAWLMAQAWPDAELHLVEQEGHGAGGLGTRDLILEALEPCSLTVLNQFTESSKDLITDLYIDKAHRNA